MTPKVNPSGAVPKKRRFISVKKKVQILDDIEAGLAASAIMEKHEICRTTVFEIRSQKDKIRKLVKDVESASESGEASPSLEKRSRLSMTCKKDVDKAVHEWLSQQRAKNVPVRGVDVQAAARGFAITFGDESFKASSGWLHKFKKRHGLTNEKMVGDAAFVNFVNVGDFQADDHSWTSLKHLVSTKPIYL